MRKFYFLVLTILMSFASFGQVFITEIGDPNDTSAIRFIELYNAGATDVDLSTGWKLEKYLNDATVITTHSVSLTGTITSKGFYILAVGAEDSNFNDAFGFPPNQWEGSDEVANQTMSNGDDPIQLLNGSTLVDLYGVIGTDGTDEPWEFQDGRAARKSTVIAGSTTFNINEWEIDSDQPTGNGAQNVADGRLNPGAWAGTPVNWTGATNTDWATQTNWSANSLPTATDNVVIPNITNKPVISSSTGAVANNIIIDASSSVSIQSGGSLIIDGTATVNGDFIYNVNVGDTNWHLISSPVKDEQYDDTWNDANSINTSGAGSNEALSTYINTSDADGDWVYYQNNAGALTFGAGIGYSLKRISSGDYTFTGTFPEPPITPIITANDIDGAAENRWTLIGNPFPAHINIATFLTANGSPLKDTHESVYVWNAVTSAYDDLAAGYIHPGQGFFVNSDVASTNVTFTKAMQSHQTGITFYKTSKPQIIVTIDDGTNTKSTEINYLANRTTGLDPRFDIGTFTGQASSFNIYTHLVSNSEGVDFTRQALPNSDYENMIIPIGVSAAIGKEITFTANNLNLPTDIKVFLEDRQINTFTRLDAANSNYKMTTTEALNGIGRFYIHSSRNSLTIKEVALKNISVYKTDASTLRISGLQNGSKTSVTLFNLLGKQVLNTSFQSNGVLDVSLPKLVTGVYIVKIQTKQGTLSKKIILE
jgi:hypothetical protein